jgi:hypothetical protein
MNPIQSPEASLANRHKQLLLLEELRRLDHQQQQQLHQQQHHQFTGAPDNISLREPTMDLRRLLGVTDQTTKSVAASSLLSGGGGGTTSRSGHHPFNNDTSSNRLRDNHNMGVVINHPNHYNSNNHNGRRISMQGGTRNNVDALQIIEESNRLRRSVFGGELNNSSVIGQSQSQALSQKLLLDRIGGGVDQHNGLGSLSSKMGGSAASAPAYLPLPSIQRTSFGTGSGGLVSWDSPRVGYGEQLDNLVLGGTDLSGKRRSSFIQQQQQQYEKNNTNHIMTNNQYGQRNKRARIGHNSDSGDDGSKTAATALSKIINYRPLSSVVLPSLTSERSISAPMTSYQKLWDSTATTMSSSNRDYIRREVFIRKVVDGRVPIIDNSERLPRGRNILLEEYLRRQSLVTVDEQQNNNNNQLSEIERYLSRML